MQLNTSEPSSPEGRKKSFPAGWTFSILGHILILALPVSLAVKGNYSEVEFFVLPEPPLERKQEIKIKPPVRIPITPEVPTRPSQEKEKEPMPPIVEPTAVHESPVVMSVPVPPSRQEERPSAPSVAYPPQAAPKSENPIETAFEEGEGPRFLRRVDPEYPALARRWGKEGKVVLRLHISEKGELLQVEVVSGQGFGLTEAAVQAVKSSTFLPARLRGNPVACKALLPIVFILRRE